MFIKNSLISLIQQKDKVMKKSMYILIAFCSILLFTAKANGQITVIGHVFAEVVESASLYCDAITDFSINSTDSPSALDLGKMTVNTGSSCSCDIVIKPATLINKTGESIKIEATAINAANQNNNQYSNRTINLTGNTMLAKAEAGVYQGSYTIVLAYN